VLKVLIILMQAQYELTTATQLKQLSIKYTFYLYTIGHKKCATLFFLQLLLFFHQFSPFLQRFKQELILYRTGSKCLDFIPNVC